DKLKATTAESIRLATELEKHKSVSQEEVKNIRSEYNEKINRLQEQIKQLTSDLTNLSLSEKKAQDAIKQQQRIIREFELKYEELQKKGLIQQAIPVSFDTIETQKDIILQPPSEISLENRLLDPLGALKKSILVI